MKKVAILGNTNTILAGQLMAAAQAGLPFPGTTAAQAVLPALRRPVLLDARAPEIQTEQRAFAANRKQRRAQQREEERAKKRADKALRELARPVVVPAGFVPIEEATREDITKLVTGEVGRYDGPIVRTRPRLDLSLIHEPRRRAKLTAIGMPKT